MKNTEGHIGTLYDIAMSIGTCLDLTEMLSNSLAAIVGKLRCQGGAVYMQAESSDGGFKFEPVYSIPRDFAATEAYSAATALIPSGPDESREFIKGLPVSGETAGGFFHILGLPSFGFVLLIKEGGAVAPDMIESLRPVLAKLAVAASACVGNESLKSSEKELQRYLYELEDHAVRLYRKNEELNQAKEALRESEERFRSVAETAGDAVISVNGKGGIIFWNRMAEVIFGFKAKDIFGRPFASVVPEKFREALTNLMRLSVSRKNGERMAVELPGIRSSGEEFPAEFSFASWVSKDDAFVTAIIRDITVRRRAENELLLLQGIHNAMNQGIPFQEVLRMAAEGVRVLFDYEVCDIMLIEKGKERLRWAALSIDLGVLRRIEELTGVNALEHRIPLFEGSAVAEMIKSAKGYVTDDVTKVFADFTDDAEVKRFAARAAAIAGFRYVMRLPLVAEEEVMGLIGVGSRREITRSDSELIERLAAQLVIVTRKGQMEEVLRESEELFRRMFEQNDDGIVMFDSESRRVIDANPTALNIFGFGKGELMDRGLALLEGLDIGELASAERIGRGAFARPDGKRIILSFKSWVVRVEDHEVVCCSFRDITEKERVEEEARVRREQLFHAGKMASLGTLVSGVAHEVNNPNNFIMFNTALVSAAWQDALGALDSYFKENGDFSMGGLPYSEMRDIMPKLLHGISDGAGRIKDIVGGLKDFSRPGHGACEDDVDLNKVVSSAVSILRNAIGKHTDKFRLECAEGLPPVRGNARQMEQVVMNLILNALESLPERSRSVTVTTLDDDGWAVLRVVDEGAGIERHDVERVTEPFFTTKHGGTGLGLSISYSIVKEHGGSLLFESEPDKGTAVTLRLPER